MPAAASAATPSARTRSTSASGMSRPSSAWRPLPRLLSSLPYFQRITSARTGATKPAAVRSAAIARSVSSAPPGYRPMCSIPGCGWPLATTTPGSRWVAGSQTQTGCTSAKRRSAARSLATPFCAVTSGSRSPAVPPPTTGASTQAASAAAVSCDFTVSTSTVSAGSGGPVRARPPPASRAVTAPSGCAGSDPARGSRPGARRGPPASRRGRPAASRTPMVPPTAPAPMITYRMAHSAPHLCRLRPHLPPSSGAVPGCGGIAACGPPQLRSARRGGSERQAGVGEDRAGEQQRAGDQRGQVDQRRRRSPRRAPGTG